MEYISGLTFNVGQCTFTIGGKTWIAPATMVTSMMADNTNPRIDAIVAQITTTPGVGTITILEGTAAVTPVVPVEDFSIEIELTHYTILAMGTTPSNVTSILLYDEDTGGPGEWTATCSTNLNCASTNNPYHGTKDIEAITAVLTNNFTLVKPSAGTLDPSTVSSLTFYIRSKGQWATGNAGANAARSLALFWLNGSVQQGVQVILRDGAFSFLSSNTTTYQQINIPIGIFGIPNGTLVTTLKVAVVGPTGSSSIGFYIDEVTLQTGAPATVPPTVNTTSQGTFANLPTACTIGAVYFVTDSPYTARCSATNTWSFFLSDAGQVFLPPAFNTWTQVTASAGSTGDTTTGSLFLQAGFAGSQWFMLSQPQPATPYTIDVSYDSFVNFTSGNGAQCSLGFRENGTHKTALLEWVNARGYFAEYRTSDINFAGNWTGAAEPYLLGPQPGTRVYERIVNSGTQLSLFISSDGTHWAQQGSTINYSTAGAPFTTAPDQVVVATVSDTTGMYCILRSYYVH